LRRSPRLAIPGGLAVGFSAGWNIANTGAAAPTLRDAYGVSLAAVGLLTTALFLTHFASQIPGGQLVDRIGAREVAFGAFAAIVLGNAVALATASFPLALAARVVIGVGTGAGFVAGSDWIRALGASPATQGLYGGFSVGGGGVAIGVVPLLEPALDWRSPYATAIAVALVLLAVVILAPAPVRPRGDALDRNPFAAAGRLYPLAVLHTASFGLSVIAGNWIVSLLKHESLSGGAAGAVGALILLAGLVTRPLAGIAVHRRPERAAGIIGISLVAGAAGCAMLAMRAPLVLLVVASAVVGLAAGIPFGAVFAGAQRLRPEAPAAAIGFVNSAATLAVLVGTPLIGLTFAMPGHGRFGFAVLAVLWAAALPAVVSGRAALTAAPPPE
jgi:MFS family permease